MSLAEYQNNTIDVNFHLQKSLEIFDKKSADKFWSKKDRGWKVPSLMPIRGFNKEVYIQTWVAKLTFWNPSLKTHSIMAKFERKTYLLLKV